jgi:hypothetical protein
MKQAIYNAMTKACEAVSLFAVIYIFALGIVMAGIVLAAIVGKVL